MSKHLWERSFYNSNIPYLISVPIREYDISKANISVLRDANVINEEQYQYFYNAPKYIREVAIGKMQGSNPELSKIKNAGIENARKMFIELNQINNNEILRIANDSITVIGDKPVRYLDITDRVHFRLDGEYTSFYRLKLIEMYYYYNIVTKNEILVIKGMNDEAKSLHKDYMIDFLSELFYSTQVDGYISAISILSNFYKSYIKMEVPLGYYREFNSQSRYKLQSISQFAEYYMDMISENERSILDISFNENLMRYLNQIYSSIHFMK